MRAWKPKGLHEVQSLFGLEVLLSTSFPLFNFAVQET